MPHRTLKTMLAGGVCAFALTAGGMAAAQTRDFDVPAGDLSVALDTYARQSGVQIIYRIADVSGVRSQGAKGALSSDEALAQLLEGTRFKIRRDPSGAIAIADASDPQSGSAAGDGADSGTVQALIVTAQKREENIQDVPIAMSAFSQEDLTRSQVAGGPDLMTQVPNFTFTKTNFSGYSIQIRGIGTQAISATTDPAVAVAFNNTPFVRNRFFEQEFYDLERVEVLRGPQGTLYGRNATAGVVNIISAKPKFGYDARLSVDVGNYSSKRLEGMLNLPLVEDKVALRLAGAWTKREGYDANQITGKQIDGRDLWSTRLSLRVVPTDRIDVNLIWEHFNENDDRLRSGKQLCNTDEVTNIGGFTVTHNQSLANTGQGDGGLWAGAQGTFSQGCKPTSLYSSESFQTPEGKSLPYYLALGAIGLRTSLTDPYVSRGQSHDLRVIESTVDPKYRAKSDTVELQAKFDLTDKLSLSSETAWASDFIWSMEDYNRFNTQSGAWLNTDVRPGVLNNGVFCDPQIGCADRLVAIDLSTARSRDFSQEFRLASDYQGPFNFSIGANFLRYDTVEKYYVFVNSFNLWAAGNFASGLTTPYVPGVSDNLECMSTGLRTISLENSGSVSTAGQCDYIDPNPIENVNDLGHTYFLSKNPYKLISYAVFGEAYYNLTDNLKLTAGLRWTVDKKEAPRIPSWVLATDVGYPVAEVIRQEWREPTGRLTLDWKPDLPFTDETLFYASYSHGYKAGGANPPVAGVALNQFTTNGITAVSATHPKTFEPEFVDAYELGAKNTLLSGRLTFNATAFYCNYTGYQISQIVDRSAINYNFDAKVWGAELETDWHPVENLRLGLKLGYENTTVADGMKAVDVMDRTAGNPDWVVVSPFPIYPSNCVLPTWLFIGNTVSDPANPELVNVGSLAGGGETGCELAYSHGFDPVTKQAYVANPPPAAFTHSAPINYASFSTDPADFPGWPANTPIGTTYPGWNPTLDYGNNHGEGFYKNLSGNELPNAPHITTTVTADYTMPLPQDWLMTLHTDFYYQSEAWTRIFNTPGYDKLKAYTNVNLAAIIANEDAGWKIMAYVKNVFDRDSITGAFLNSDDTGLTTNVFLTEPRLYGLRITKEWTGGAWWTGANPNHPAGAPYPMIVEISGQLQRLDAPSAPLRPSFADAFAPGVNNFYDAQDDDFDWGDGRDIKVTWRPVSGPWQVSAAFRNGRANSGVTRRRNEQNTERTCLFGGPYASFCRPDAPSYYYQFRTDFADAAATKHEEHELVDFAIGRDFGLGRLGRSELSGGLRLASFKSKIALRADGTPDWDFPAGWYIPGYDVTHTFYRANLAAEREFRGAGPAVSWDASIPVVGSQEGGHLDLAWSVSGGVLFGKQKSSISGSGSYGFYQNNFLEDGILVVYPAYGKIPPDTTGPTRELNATRTKSATVPMAGVSLGLSYSVDRFSVGTGYRWERYFNVLDAGFQEHKSYDRTIDGPYFKIAVGFGG